MNNKKQQIKPIKKKRNVGEQNDIAYIEAPSVGYSYRTTFSGLIYMCPNMKENLVAANIVGELQTVISNFNKLIETNKSSSHRICIIPNEDVLKVYKKTSRKTKEYVESAINDVDSFQQKRGQVLTDIKRHSSSQK